jgi:hypothetical protein
MFDTQPAEGEGELSSGQPGVKADKPPVAGITESLQKLAAEQEQVDIRDCVI